MAKKKQMTGFLSDAYCSDKNVYPTHSIVTLDHAGIKKILKHMDRVKRSKDIVSVTIGVGYCQFFMLQEHTLEKLSALLGVEADRLLNVSSDVQIPLFAQTEVSEDLVEAFRTHDVDTEVHETYVMWKAQEKYNDMLMESPCIDRSVLEKWLAGNYL